MKKIIFVFVFAGLFISTLCSQNSSKTSYTIDVKNSSIKWKGYKVIGDHEGTIEFKSGVIAVKNGKVVGGKVIVQMETIKDIDGSKKLESHLKNADFFEVDKFPTATFSFKSTKKKEGKLWIKGKITIKGVTEEINFPAKLTVDKSGITLTTDTFQIDRAKFGIKYKSKSFQNNLKDKYIKDNFDLQVSLKASASQK